MIGTGALAVMASSPADYERLDLPDGRHFEKVVHYPPGEWSTAKDHADVRSLNPSP